MMRRRPLLRGGGMRTALRRDQAQAMCPRMVASRNLASRKLEVPAMLVVVKHRESRR